MSHTRGCMTDHGRTQLCEPLDQHLLIRGFQIRSPGGPPSRAPPPGTSGAPTARRLSRRRGDSALTRPRLPRSEHEPSAGVDQLLPDRARHRPAARHLRATAVAAWLGARVFRAHNVPQYVKSSTWWPRSAGTALPERHGAASGHSVTPASGPSTRRRGEGADEERRTEISAKFRPKGWGPSWPPRASPARLVDGFGRPVPAQARDTALIAGAPSPTRRSSMPALGKPPPPLLRSSVVRTTHRRRSCNCEQIPARAARGPVDQ